jgi:hypothetical protein
VPANENPRRLLGEVRLLRLRVASAESALAALREQARAAKLRRKEAKRLAQRARRQFRRGKSEVTDLKHALAKAEAKLFQAGGRALTRKLAKPPSVTRRVARSTANRAGVGSRRSPAANSSRQIAKPATNGT